MARAAIVAGLTFVPSSEGRELRAIARAAEWLEVRADLIGDLDPKWVRNFFPGKLLYSLRSRAAGGAFKGSEIERASRLLGASHNYDLVELEAESDLRPDLLSGIAAENRMLSWYGRPTDYSDLVERFNRLSSIQSRFYKMEIEGGRSEDAFGLLRLMKSLGRSDLIAFASGKSGLWTRLIALQFGAPIIFGSADLSWAVDGSPPVLHLVEDYGLPSFSSIDEIYGIVGNPVIHSLSPRIHNAAYRALGYPALFVPFQVESFGDFWRDVIIGEKFGPLNLSIKGLTVSSPYKEVALRESHASSHASGEVGAANVLVRNNGQWKADTTDPEGVMLAICEQDFSVRGKRAAVVGCGGAGRAVAAALDKAGADVTLVNRGSERAHLASQFLSLPCVALSSFAARGYSILVNATPVGRDDNNMPFELTGLSNNTVVVDLVYRPTPTPLIAKARALGQVAIDGQEVLLIQVANQFRKMTGQDMPINVAREALGRNRRPAMSGLTA